MSTIMAQRMRLQTTIADAERKLFELQGECNHPDAFRIQNRQHLLFEHNCPDCGKQWKTAQ